MAFVLWARETTRSRWIEKQWRDRRTHEGIRWHAGEACSDAQQRVLHSERLATIGIMASSISHDLRHPLTAVLANAEFLAEPDLSPKQREELYLEIRVAVHRLTDLIDSLLELSRPAGALNLAETVIEHPVSRAVELIRAHPEFQKVSVSIASNGVHDAMCDSKKMERVFYNLLLNSCQSVQSQGGHVTVSVENGHGQLEIRVIDDGPGLDDVDPRQGVSSFREPREGKWHRPGTDHRAQDRAGPLRRTAG